MEDSKYIQPLVSPGKMFADDVDTLHTVLKRMTPTYGVLLCVFRAENYLSWKENLTVWGLTTLSNYDRVPLLQRRGILAWHYPAQRAPGW